MTTSRALKRLFAAAMLCAALPCTAFASDELTQLSRCRKPVYPREALLRSEAGVSMIGFLVRTDGTVGESTILSSSGSPRLDQEARSVLSTCVFTPASKDGSPIESWVQTSYVWSYSEDPDMTRAIRETAIAASKGDAAAYFQLSLQLSKVAKTDADRGRALIVLLSAAEMGYPHAQFEAGRRYEKGLGVDANPEKAQHWYEKAAAQGDVLALQRLRLGYLPN